MMLQEAIEFTEYFRCYVHRPRATCASMPLRPASAASPPLRAESAAVDPALLERIERDALTLCRALGYDFNTVEFAVATACPTRSTS